MSPEFRDQVNTARRAGYTDPEILSFVAQQSPDLAAKIQEAVGQGYDPQAIMGFLAPQPTTGETAQRYAGIITRAASPYLTTAAGGATAGTMIGGPVGGVVGTIAGLLAQGFSDAAIAAYNALVDPQDRIPNTTEGIRMLYDKLGVGGVKPETRGERIVEAGTEALAGTVPMVKAGQLGKTLPGGVGAVATEVSRAPLTQIISAPVIGGTTQFTAEATGSPLAALLAGTTTAAAAGARPRIRGVAPSKEQMEKSINSAYDILNKSTIVIKDDSFNNAFVSGLESKLRAAGYSPTNTKFAGITSLLEDLKSNVQTKDATELQAIRQRISSSADPNEANAYRLMRTVRDEFDNYLANLPDSALSAGNKGDLLAWKSARNLFQRQSKANIFDKILEDAPISKGVFSQSGVENYLYNELRKIARDDKKMRLFTKDEQASIRAAAEGSNIQNVLKVFGKLSPTGFFPLMSTFGIGAFVSPEVASGMAAVGMGSRKAAEQMRTGSIERIIDQILSGQRPPSPALNVPTTVSRGLLSTELE